VRIRVSLSVPFNDAVNVWPNEPKTAKKARVKWCANGRDPVDGGCKLL
jgi:hypothetical protein